MDLKQIGTKIRVTRVSRGLNQENIATELGISITAYSKIERGETNPSILRLDQIAKCLGVPIVDFLTESGYVSLNQTVRVDDENSSNVELENVMLKREISHLNSIIENKNEIIRLLKKGENSK